MTMRFCKNCGQLQLRNKRVCTCNAMPDQIRVKDRFVRGMKSSKRIGVQPSGFINEKCQRCGMQTIGIEVAQTRAADESPTRFYKCATCEHSRVEYN